MLDRVRVHVVDSGTTSMHMDFMLFEAAETVRAGGSVPAALAAIDRVKEHSPLFFTVTDIEHLAASGRTEGAEKATETAVSVKPVVGILDGVPKAVGAERSQRAALQKVLDLTAERMGNRPIKRLAIVNGNIPERAAQWYSEVAQALGFSGQPIIIDFGPGLLGIAVQWE